MASNKHVYLKNELTKNDGFKKTRNVQSNNEERIEVSKFPNSSQQDRLRRSNAILYSERKVRSEQRTIDVPASIELVSINFYTVFNNDLQAKFLERYGLLVSYYEDFNKTVLFEIANSSLFQTFVKHLELYYESPLTESYEGKEYNLIPLIHNFRFLSSRRRIKSSDTKSSILHLIPAQNKAASSIYESLLKYLEESKKTIHQTDLTNTILEVSNLSRDNVEEIVKNFDIVKAVTSTRTERRRPGTFGNTRRDYGFTVTVEDSLPIVGIIDTGVYRIDPLDSCITNISYDLTETAPYWDESGHGTLVAGLVALGHEFQTEVKTTYIANAKIAVIKAIHTDNDPINIIQLINTIKKANEEHNIKLFNLSLNDPLPKSYNQRFSDYAYLLDKLSYENDLLIFISVGNIPSARLYELINTEPHDSHEYPNIFYCPDEGSPIHQCETTNLSEPSESLNNVSIGALAGNLEPLITSDISPDDQLPAYYTRKFHYDYEQKINGTDFMRSQKNKHLNKPDLIFEGGDLFKYESGMEILRSPLESDKGRFFSRASGTSLATPLITSLGAKILKEYSSFRTQTIKALLVNSSYYPLGENITMFRGYPINLLKKLSGFGKPNSNILTSTDNNSITFVIEDIIELDELQVINLKIPDYINRSGNKLNFRGTLCYSFLPIQESHLHYLPLQISFGIFKPITAEEMGKKDDRANKVKGTQTADYIIKSGMSWSDDFYGVDNRLFSNTQHIDHNVTGEKIEEIGNNVSIGIRCVGKNEIPQTHLDHLKNSKHEFSIIITVTELPLARANNRLYQEISAINNIENIASLDSDITVEIGE